MTRLEKLKELEEKLGKAMEECEDKSLAAIAKQYRETLREIEEIEGVDEGDDRIAEIVDEVFDFRPAAIIRDLDLRRPIYRQTAAYGHFGRTDVDLPWEHTDKVEAVKAAAGI